MTRVRSQLMRRLGPYSPGSVFTTATLPPSPNSVLPLDGHSRSPQPDGNRPAMEPPAALPSPKPPPSKSNPCPLGCLLDRLTHSDSPTTIIIDLCTNRSLDSTLAENHRQRNPHCVFTNWFVVAMATSACPSQYAKPND
jgi:hypothetical protein